MEISGIGFENFRVFKDRCDFDLAPITVLTGANSSGKSTFIKGLKLLQSFWNQQGFGHHLDFENGNHWLGDFEMCLSKKSNNKDIIKIIYKIKNILFEELFVELEFCLDKNSDLKNGLLSSAVLYTKEKQHLYTILIGGDSTAIGYNYKYIINKLLPHVLNLHSEYKEYSKLANTTPNFVSVEDDFFEDDYYSKLSKHQEKCKQLCAHQQIDYERFLELDKMFNHRDEMNKLSFDEIDNYYSFYQDYEKTSFFYNSEILDLFCHLQKSDYTLFFEYLWMLIIEKYPQIKEKHDYSSFKEFSEKQNIGLWVEFFINSGEKSFESFYKTHQDLSFDIISNTVIQTLMGITDREKNYDQKFYDELEFTEDTWMLENEGGDMMFRNHKSVSIFHLAGIYSDLKKIPSVSPAIVCAIIHDMIEIEKEIKGEEPKFSGGIALSGIKRNFRNLIFKVIRQFFEKSYFIDSIRADSQRLYSFSTQSIEFHTFIIEFLKIFYTDVEKAFIKKWLKEYEIADDWKPEIVRGVGSQIFLIKDNEKINLVDLGYGVTQFLPILLKIIYCNNTGKKTIVIEEPETNLHPKFQSKLANLFVDAQKTFGISFIIETHSEYLIRKLQYLTAKGEIKPDDTVIHYIGSPNPDEREYGEEQVRTIRIKPNGHLTKPFGSGFFDEADRLALLLLDYPLN